MSRIFTKIGKLAQEAYDNVAGPEGATPKPQAAKAAPTPQAAPAGQEPGSIEEMAQASVTSEEAVQVPNVEQTPLDPRTGASPLEFTPEESAQNAQDLNNFDVMGGNLTGRKNPRRNINLDFFADEETKKTIEYYNRDQGVAGPDELPARRVVSHGETLSKAVAADGLSDVERRERITKLIGGSINDKWQPEDLVGIYQMLNAQGSELHEAAVGLTAKLDEGVDVGAEELAHYQLLESRFNATMEIASTRAAEAGRMLNALKALGTQGTRDYARTIDEVVRGNGGKISIQEKARLMAGLDPENMDAVGDLARKGVWARFKDGLVRLRYNMMLSSMRTHVANVGGSIMSGLYEGIPLNVGRVAASNIDYGWQILAKKTFDPDRPLDPMDRARLSEIVTLPYDMIMATRNAFTAGKDVFTGKRLGHGKLFNEMGVIHQAGTEAQSPAGKAWTTAKKIGDTPTRLLEAEDTFFRTVFYDAKISQHARRAAALEADEASVDEVYNALVKNPTDNAQKDAEDFAAKLTFTNDPSAYGQLLGGLAEGVSKFQDTVMGRLIFPFVRTPVNITAYTLEQTALNSVTAPKKLLADMMSKDKNKAADARSRVAIAAGLWIYLKDHWDKARITGDNPGNYGLQRARELGGWRANSLRVGDQYYELNRADPMGMVLGVMNTAYDAGAQATAEDSATIMAAGIVTVASMITDRSMLAGIGDLERVFKASEGTIGRTGGKFVARLGSSFVVPSFMRDFREMKDPISRSMDVPDTIIEGTYQAFRKTVMNAAPGWSEDLPPQVDGLGNDRIRNEGFIWRGIIPIRSGTIDQDPAVVAWIATNTPISKPDEEISVAGSLPVSLLKLDNYQGWAYRKYQQIVGRNRKEKTMQFLRTSVWKDAVAEGNYGPNSLAAKELYSIKGKADQESKFLFLKWLEKKGKSFIPTVEGKPVGKVELDPLTIEQLKNYTIAARKFAAKDEEMRKLIQQKRSVIYRYKAEPSGIPEELQVKNPNEAPRF